MQPVKHMWILVMHGKRRSLVLVARLSSTSRTLAVGLNPANPAEAAWGPRTEGLRKEAGPPRRLHCVCTACAVCDARSDVTCGSTQSTGQDRVYSICIPGRALHLRSWMSWTLDLDPLARSARFSPESAVPTLGTASEGLGGATHSLCYSRHSGRLITTVHLR